MGTKDIGDITAGELLELLADDEMIESGYDREGMVALLLLCRVGLQVLCGQIDGLQQELAELRRIAANYELRGVWPDGEEQPDVLPDRIVFVGRDGEPEPRFAVDARPLLKEVLRRQAREWCRSVSDGEGPALEQLLSLVAALPKRLELIVVIMADGASNAGWWEEGGPQLAGAIRPTYQAAIRAATCELLGLAPVGGRQLSGSPADLIRASIELADAMAATGTMTGDTLTQLCRAQDKFVAAVDALRGTAAAEPRQTCGSCQHWRRDDEPATEGGAKPCGLDEEHDPAPRHPDSSCGLPGYYKAHPCASCDDEPDDCEYPWNLFECDTCEQQRPWCQGAADAYPGTCDDCVAALPLPEAKTDPAPDSDNPPLKGVTQPADNLIRSEGGES